MPRKYGKKSQEFVKEAMHEFKRGELKSWKSWEPVKNPKQAVAIGLSEARKEGVQVPNPPKNKTKSPKNK
ncbi:MAG: hypothetical protein ACD_3C00213G0006 [uncultured bacterium (gcode 4)]|uniref:Uncharacterized protein n=1 Tax=uncultured bacterium (gcode 4) TaxID=1234023 RepID=K2FZQ0_9BACT|nr:MAG: hypothetical protein ACD_3C00213G0006 [uncultured bacterium (gcode 4)]